MTATTEAIIKLIEEAVPQLKDKIQPGAVTEKTTLPYIAYSLPKESPIRTIHGIAGYTTTFQLFLYDRALTEVNKLQRLIVTTVDSQRIDGKKVTLQSVEGEYFAEYKLQAKIITFKIV